MAVYLLLSARSQSAIAKLCGKNMARQDAPAALMRLVQGEVHYIADQRQHGLGLQLQLSWTCTCMHSEPQAHIFLASLQGLQQLSFERVAGGACLHACNLTAALRAGGGC